MEQKWNDHKLTFANEMKSQPIIFGMDAIIKDCNFRQWIWPLTIKLALVVKKCIKGRKKTEKKRKKKRVITYPFAPYILSNLTTGYCSNHGTHIGQRTKQRELAANKRTKKNKYWKWLVMKTEEQEMAYTKYQIN